MEEKLDNFVILPRVLVTLVQEGTITPTEFMLLAWLRAKGNPYGITDTSMEDIAHDLELKKSYVNKLLLHLKSCRLIFYKDRKGKRGSFQIHHGYWRLPNKGIKSIAPFFENDNNPKEDSLPEEPLTSQRLEIPSQKSVELKSLVVNLSNKFSQRDPVRSSYNDTHTNKDIDTHTSNRLSFKKGIQPQRFTPDSWEEERCKEMAIELNEGNMDYMLGTLNKHGFHIIERAWGQYREIPNKSHIENRGAYFASIVTSLLNGESQTI